MLRFRSSERPVAVRFWWTAQIAKSYILLELTSSKDYGALPLPTSFLIAIHLFEACYGEFSAGPNSGVSPARVLLTWRNLNRANDISAELVIDTEADESNSAYYPSAESKYSHSWIVYVKQDGNLKVRNVDRKEESEIRSSSELYVW